MFSKLFGSKMEKDLKAFIEKSPEVVMRYRDNENVIPSRILKIFRDTLVIMGFPGKLQQREFHVRLQLNGVGFDTAVSKVGKDKAGKAVFYCKLPERLLPPGKDYRRFIIHPNGSAKVLVSTNKGEKSLKLPIYDLSEMGINLVNETDVAINIGTKFYQSLVTIGGGQAHLIDMQVANLRKGPAGLMLCCGFTTPPRALSEMLSTAKGLVPKPASPKK